MPVVRKSELSNFKSQIPSPVTSLSHQGGKYWEPPLVPRSFNLTDLQLLAIEHTLRGVNDSRIAEMLDISRKTLWNWKTFNEHYRRALAEGRAAVHASVIDRLQATAIKASDTIEDLLDDCDEKTRLRAAQIAMRAVADLRPKLPNDQYHSSQSLHFGIVTTAPPKPSAQLPLDPPV
jgi:hypothetical protein